MSISGQLRYHSTLIFKMQEVFFKFYKNLSFKPPAKAFALCIKRKLLAFDPPAACLSEDTKVLFLPLVHIMKDCSEISSAAQLCANRSAV